MILLHTSLAHTKESCVRGESESYWKYNAVDRSQSSVNLFGAVALIAVESVSLAGCCLL